MSKSEKFIILLLTIALIVVNVFIFLIAFNMPDKKVVQARAPGVNKTYDAAEKREILIDANIGVYEVYQNDRLIDSFMDYNDAVEYAKKFDNSSVKYRGGDKWLWDSSPPFNVYIGDSDEAEAFMTFPEAVFFARSKVDANIYYRRSNSFIWNNHENASGTIITGVPVILQYPELFRGCEVTSLAMLLNFKGVEVNKMTLAEKIRKDPSVYEVKNGIKYFGNPNYGFVGDIYKAQNKGLGVYHQPVFELALEYLPDKALDLTGCSFEDLYYFLDKKSPIWIITNSTFKKLPSSAFETWHTPTGIVSITYREHSVLITGYDDNYVYINDPLNKNANVKKNKKDFIEAWEQMGRQAITCVP